MDLISYLNLENLKHGYGLLKDDSAIFPATMYRHTEVNRPDSINRHLWSKSGFINAFDSLVSG